MKKCITLVILILLLFCLTACSGESSNPNLAAGSSDDWSDWMTPEYNAENRTFYAAYAYLGEKQIGDEYTCQLEIEFQGVTGGDKFEFQTQGAADGSWKIGNVWDNKLLKLAEPPQDGIYKYILTNQITEKNVDAAQFNLGFRCDFWSSGSFRVRNIKVEKGSVATAWIPSKYDEGDGVNLAVGTSSEWSEWFTPENKENHTFNPFYAILPANKEIGDAYTCSFEIEFKDVIGDDKFVFRTQGSVDGTWETGNVWNGELLMLTRSPENGVYKYTSTVRITEKNKSAVHFNLGFRCDYWRSGSFHVRNVKVEKGTSATNWTP